MNLTSLLFRAISPLLRVGLTNPAVTATGEGTTKPAESGEVIETVALSRSILRGDISAAEVVFFGDTAVV